MVDTDKLSIQKLPVGSHDQNFSLIRDLRFSLTNHVHDCHHLGAASGDNLLSKKRIKLNTDQLSPGQFKRISIRSNDTKKNRTKRIF